MLNAQSVARALNGKVRGNRVVAAGPGHSVLDYSLWVTIDPSAPDGFLVKSFAQDDFRECRDYVRFRLGLPAWQPTQNGDSEPRQRSGARTDLTSVSIDTDEDRSRTNNAIALFKEAVPLAGTLGETYLAHRIGSTMPWPSDLRFHGRCARRVNNAIERHPAVVALLRNIQSNEPQAVQRVFLQSDGGDRLRDATGKMSLGPTCGAVVKLSPNAEVTAGLGICEGVEKSLSLMAVGWCPIWATAGTSGMSTFPALSGIESLTAFADPDAPGQKAASTCAQRWADAGKEVQIITPRAGDWSDALRGEAA